jgi:hypothetical protein
MSFSTLFFVAALAGAYKLGRFNANRPGEAWRALRETGLKTWKWMNQ